MSCIIQTRSENLAARTQLAYSSQTGPYVKQRRARLRFRSFRSSRIQNDVRWGRLTPSSASCITRVIFSLERIGVFILEFLIFDLCGMYRKHEQADSGGAGKCTVAQDYNIERDKLKRVIMRNTRLSDDEIVIDR